MTNYWQDVKAIAREVWEMFQDPEHPFDESSSESREGETWMAVSNSRWITAKKKWQDVLGLSRNVPEPDDLGIDPHRKRVYWMPPYPEYTHWWDFVPGEDPELTVKRLGAAAAMKRDVDAEIAVYDQMRKKRWGMEGAAPADSVKTALEEARASGLIQMLVDSASESGWKKPMTPEDVLMWTQVILEEEKTFLEDADEEVAARAFFLVSELQRLSDRLTNLGVRPAAPPWGMKRKRWGLNDVETDAVLEEAKEEGVYGILEQIAEYYQVQAPESSEEILGWLLYARDEEMRTLSAGGSDYERAEAETRILLVGKFIRKLKMLEVIPVSPPWIRERKKWGLMGFWDSRHREPWMRVLDAAEAEDELASAISEDAANRGERGPETAQEWLAWIENQARIDLVAAEAFESQGRRDWAEEAWKRRDLARRTAEALRKLGIKPAPMPWDKERLRWKPT